MPNRTSGAMPLVACILLTLCAFLLTASSDRLLQGSIDDEVRAKQTLGRAIASPVGKFSLYEWMRPYSWDKDFGTVPPDVAQHMQSWIYRVDADPSPAESKYLFNYESGSSYWLGALSPDSSRVSFYALDDDNKLKTGVWDFAKSKITWFEAPPDEKHLEESPVWVRMS